MKQKRTPMRMCISCREMKPKKEIIRIVRSADGKINVDLTGKISGRGAYICNDIKCVDAAKKQKNIERVFGTTGNESLYDALLEIASHGIDNRRDQ